MIWNSSGLGVTSVKSCSMACAATHVWSFHIFFPLAKMSERIFTYRVLYETMVEQLVFDGSICTRGIKGLVAVFVVTLVMLFVLEMVTGAADW